MKYCFIAVLVFFIYGCSVKNQNASTQSLNTLIISPMVKIHDVAFLKKENHMLNLEVYKLGRAFFQIKIKDKICLNFICYDKEVFNQKFFKNIYYEDILKDILNKNVLWQGRNIEKTSCGFKQNLKSKNYEIFYQVCYDKVSFFDNISGIKIVLTYIQN
ncbi:hypothetical protein N4T57_06575 [Campylobacter hepaticus]|uniref:Lipoprotein n=1 Tax=Campylobacter hepaticus TaxID=1813019 RepID=A0A6A7JQL6_9BACT|nr:hypothetical protein [Campylobacter hepaticus]AXP09468.1 hypothetical protein A2J15_007385 [Campylobacter hepaticus]MCZ0772787.1 hypothetical protein [Campylobacter hepaticus]MCZ0774255.1 hypothetical protein [Campylobacter hepaticus]MCZ0775507.1 hypothetical protein [Campylobacter hepaticus]MDX2323210.1 hypothetical protein [Campylobacter hepaticus]